MGVFISYLAVADHGTMLAEFSSNSGLNNKSVSTHLGNIIVVVGSSLLSAEVSTRVVTIVSVGSAVESVAIVIEVSGKLVTTDVPISSERDAASVVTIV